MTSWKRLAIVAFCVVAVVYLSDSSSHRYAALLGAVISILACPFGQRLINWVESGYFSPVPPVPPLIDDIPLTPLRGPSEATTALLVAGISIYALLFTCLAFAAQLGGFDRLEHAKMMTFTDTGYGEAQKYLVGSLFLAVGAPAITSACMVLAGSNRRISLRAFVAGIAISLPVYFLVARWIGLPTGIGDVTQPSTALGSQFPTTPGYSGFEITARLIQGAMLFAFGIGLAVYGWAVANITRAMLNWSTRVLTTAKTVLVRKRRRRP